MQKSRDGPWVSVLRTAGKVKLWILPAKAIPNHPQPLPSPQSVAKKRTHPCPRWDRYYRDSKSEQKISNRNGVIRNLKGGVDAERGNDEIEIGNFPENDFDSP